MNNIRHLPTSICHETSFPICVAPLHTGPPDPDPVSCTINPRTLDTFRWPPLASLARMTSGTPLYAGLGGLRAPEAIVPAVCPGACWN